MGVGYVWFFQGDGQGSALSGLTENNKQWLQLQNQVRSIVNDPVHMAKVMERNHSRFGCMYSDLGSCRAFSGSPFVLYDRQGDNLSQLPKNFGVSLQGVACGDFPSQDCPVRIDASWKPHCDSSSCEPTLSANIFVKMTLQQGKNKVDDWHFATRISPAMQLSARARCLRDGKYYQNGKCERFQLSPEVRQARAVANAARDARAADEEKREDYLGRDARDGVAFDKAPVCPEFVSVAGEEYNIDELDDNGRAIVRVDSAAGCTYPDKYTFRCAGKLSKSNADAREPASRFTGNWVQVDASIAQCDESGQPVSSQKVRVSGRPEYVDANLNDESEEDYVDEYNQETEPLQSPQNGYPQQYQNPAVNGNPYYRPRN